MGRAPLRQRRPSLLSRNSIRAQARRVEGGGRPTVYVIGWDTETTLGYVKLLASSDGASLDAGTAPAEARIVGVAETGDRDHPERVSVATLDTLALLDLLFAEGMRADYNVFWNVRFDFAAIFKPWVVAQGARLKENHRRRLRLSKELALLEASRLAFGAPMDARAVAERIRRRAIVEELDALESVEHFDLGRYRVKYIPKKGFQITRARRQRGKNSVTFFDAMVFYATGLEDSARLDTMARRYLGSHKTAAEEGIDVALLGSVEGYYEAHREAIVRYCRQDASLTARLFSLTVDGFERIGFPFPDRPWSRASVGREMLRSGVEGLVPEGVLEPTRETYEKLRHSGHARLWVNAYAGACILTRGVGSWDDVSKWDVNSAYPWAMALFPSLDGAYLVGPDDPRFAGCFFRFYEIELTPTPRRALRDRDGSGDHLLYHHGGERRRVCVTGADLETFDLWGDPYRIVEAVGVVTPSKERPLAFLRDLYRRKSEIKAQYGEDSVEYLNAKIPLNGVYGILTQSRPREGRYTNYIYGAYITALCRRELWRKARELEALGGTVLAYLTDGLFVSGLPSLPAPSKDLGGWDVEDVGLVTLFANGIYVAKGKLRKRGAPHLTVEALMRSDRPYVTTRKTNPLGLKAGILQACPERIGVFEEEAKTLCPARMLEESGLRMRPDLRAAPLSAFFTERWFLDHRTPTEAHLPPNLLPVEAE